MRPHIPIVVALILTAGACGKDAPSVTDAAGAGPTPSVGTAVTGGGTAAEAPEEAPPVVAARRAREQAEREAIAVDPALTRPERLVGGRPLATLSLVVADDGASYTGALTYRRSNTTERALDELVFALPANLGAGADRPVRIDRVTVDGAPVEPTGNASLLRVPVDTAPGAEARVEITFGGVIPALPARAFGIGPQDLELAAGLLAVDPPGAAATGRRDGATLLAHAYPMPVPVGAPIAEGATAADVGLSPVVHYMVDVTVPGGVDVVGTGVEVARERLAEGRRHVRLAAPATREVAVVLAEGLAERTEKVGDVEVVVAARPAGDAAARSVATAARRALEVYEQALGRFPRGRLALVEGPLSSGAAVAFPGLVVVDSLFFAPLAPADADQPVLAVLTRHPALREGLEYAVAHAVAHQWWGDLVATDRVKAPWVDEALASVAALGYFGDAGARKAARRQRELFLALPYQVARSTGAPDRPVRTSPARLRTALEAAAIHHGKAALWLDATRRLMSDTQYRHALRGVVDTYAWGVLGEDELVRRLAADAPRPREVEELATRWLEQTHGDEDIGALRPDLLAEYLVSDAGVQGGARELLGLLANNAQVKQLLGELLKPGPDGEVSLDAMKLVGVAAQLLGEDAPPEMKRWLDVLAKAGAGGPPSTWGPEVVGRLVGELGLGEEEQQLVKGLGTLLFKALEDEPDDNAVAPDDAPTPPE